MRWSLELLKARILRVALPRIGHVTSEFCRLDTVIVTFIGIADALNIGEQKGSGIELRDLAVVAVNGGQSRAARCSYLRYQRSALILTESKFQRSIILEDKVKSVR